VDVGMSGEPLKGGQADLQVAVQICLPLMYRMLHPSQSYLGTADYTE
jgi:hypothetical protein